ncbi:hypothetical protein MTO96_033732, partial [Rhipicephalus appendiculatus]
MGRHGMDVIGEIANGHAYVPPPDYGNPPPTIFNAPVTPGFTTAPPIEEGDWWTQTKLRYRQQWKKTDPVLPAVPASLGLVGTAASLAGNLTGAGMVMIPFAFVWIGWSFIFWLPLFGALAAFNASLLESCCKMLEERHEEYRRFHWYTQYSDIANRALGPGLAKVVSALRLLCVVGVWAVDIVIISAVLVDFLALIIPVTLPKGYMYCGLVVGYGVLFTLYSGNFERRCGLVNTPMALVLMILLVTGIAGNKNTAEGIGGAIFTIRQADFSFLVAVLDQSRGVLYFVGLGILVFNFAGVCGFTNIRRDMKEPPCFTKAAAFGVAGSTLALFVVGVTACAVLGPFNGNVVLSMLGRDVRIAADIFTVICSEQAMYITYLIMGEYDRVEDYGKRVAWSRALRTSPLVLCAGVIAVALPYEGPLMGLVGSLALCPVAFVLPAVFYYKLCQGSDQWPAKPLSTKMKICLALTVVSGLLVFIGGTFSSITQLVKESSSDAQSCFRGFCYDQKFALTPVSITLQDIILSGGK